MGRRKIAIQPLTDERNRSVTFLKRKAGLFKKAHELAVLCQVEIAVIIVGNNQKLYEFSSGDTDGIIKRYKNTSPQESKGPDDFDPNMKYSNKTRNAVSRQRPSHDNQTSDEEEDADEDDDDSVGTPPASPQPKSESTPQSGRGKPINRRSSRQPAPAETASRTNARKGKRKSSERQEATVEDQQQVQYAGNPVYHMNQRFQYPPETQQQSDPRRMAPSQTMGYGPPYGQTNPPYGYYTASSAMTVSNHTRGYSDQLKMPQNPTKEKNAFYGVQQRPHSVNSGRSSMQMSSQTQTSMIPNSSRAGPNTRPKTKPKLKVQIPQGETNENISSSDHQGLASSPDSKAGENPETRSTPSLRSGQPRSGNENGANAAGPWGSLLPPPSPSSYLNPQGIRPGNPFGGRPPLINSNGEQTPISAALPSKYVNDLLPSPSNFYGTEWNLHFGPSSAAPMSAGIPGPGSAGNPASGHPGIGMGMSMSGIGSGASGNGGARSAQTNDNTVRNGESSDNSETGTRTRRKPGN